ncbi:hypothetical protein ABE10_00055, partial [Bacillus toyonensis]|nr:hypothetical protein [Bacillus toyonensis]
MTAHDLGDHAALMRVTGRAQTVHRLGGDVHGRVEAEGVVRGAQIVVYRLRHPDDVDAVLREPIGRSEGALAADRDDPVDLVAIQGLRDVLGPAPFSLVGVGPTRPEDRPAHLGQALHLVPSEREEVAVHDAAPAVADPDELEVVGRGPLEHDATDHGVESGAIAAAGENADLHAAAFTLRVGKGPATLPASTLAPSARRTPFPPAENRSSY